MKAPIESSPKHVRRIGTIAVKWAMLDTILARLMGEALDDYRMGEAIYYSVSSQGLRFDQLRAAVGVRIWPGCDVKGRLLHLIDRLDKLWGARNDLMHNHAVAIYKPGQAGARLETQIKRPIRKEKQTSKPLTIQILDDHIAAVERIGGELWDFVWLDQVKRLQEMKAHVARQQGTAPAKLKVKPVRHGPFP